MQGERPDFSQVVVEIGAHVGLAPHPGAVLCRDAVAGEELRAAIVLEVDKRHENRHEVFVGTEPRLSVGVELAKAVWRLMDLALDPVQQERVVHIPNCWTSSPPFAGT